MSIQLNFKILFFNSKIHTVLIYKTLEHIIMMYT